MISSCLTREETMNNFWSLKISCHSKEEIWFMKVFTNSHSILKQLGHKPKTSHMRREKNKFVSQRPNILSIMPIMHSSICHDLAKQLKSLFIFLLYFFSFSFILDLLYRRECRKVSYHKCHKYHNHMTGSHNLTSYDVI